MPGETSDDIDEPAEKKDAVAEQEGDPRDEQGIKEKSVAPSEAENQEDRPRGDGTKKKDASLDIDEDNIREGESRGAGVEDCPPEDGIRKDAPDEESPDGGSDANPPISIAPARPFEADVQVEAEGVAMDKMAEDLAKKSPLRDSSSDGLKKGDEEIGNSDKRETVPNEEERSGADVETDPSVAERPKGDLDANPSAVDAEVESAIDRMVEGMVNESPPPESKLDENSKNERGDDGSNDGGAAGGEEVKEKGGEASDNTALRPGYPPPPPGYEHYPPPPGYYPYPPHYPPHPYYGYPPPPPGYYPPPPGYYMPPGHPHPPPPPLHPAPPGERDPATGNFVYGGPPPAAAAPAKRTRTRIKTPQDVINRKLRKNAQSRFRAARLRERVESIKNKGDDAKTEDEAQLYHKFEERRARKNHRSKERALEKKAELERIAAKPEGERTEEEVETLKVAAAAKRRKNEGDRLRRERLKGMGLAAKPAGVRVRGRLPSAPTSPPPNEGSGTYLC